MAEQKDNTISRSTSAAAIQSPTVGGQGYQGIGTDAQRIAREALSRVQSAGTDNTDYAYRQGLTDIENQINAAKAQKDLIGLGALQSVGDLHNTIFENERERREKAAGSGFMGGMQGVRNQRDFNSKIRSSEGTLERGTENKLRTQNLQLAQLSDQELSQLQGTNAMSAVVAEEIARRQLSGQEQGLFGMSHDQGFWGSMAGMFGKDQTYSADLHADSLKQSQFFQNIASELGINLDDKSTMDRLASALKKTVTQKQGMFGGLDLFSPSTYTGSNPYFGRSSTVNIGGKSSTGSGLSDAWAKLKGNK